jgi:hypothetical protein
MKMSPGLNRSEAHFVLSTDEENRLVFRNKMFWILNTMGIIYMATFAFSSKIFALGAFCT